MANRVHDGWTKHSNNFKCSSNSNGHSSNIWWHYEHSRIRGSQS